MLENNEIECICYQAHVKVVLCVNYSSTAKSCESANCKIQGIEDATKSFIIKNHEVMNRFRQGTQNYLFPRFTQ